MKTEKEIKQKIKALTKKLITKQPCENFGDREQRELADFIGFVYSYPYFERPKIWGLLDKFNEWCWGFTGGGR